MAKTQTQPEQLTPKQFAERIGSNAWRWGLAEFCAATGFVGDYAKQKFLQFRALAETLAEFDAGMLAIFASRPEPVPEDDTPLAKQPADEVAFAKATEGTFG